MASKRKHGIATFSTMEVNGSSEDSDYHTLEKGDNDVMKDNEESHLRSILKGISWRCLATATTVVISAVVIGEVGTALQIGAFEFVAKLGVYYVHERVWTKIKV